MTLLARAENFIWENARHLERAIFATHFHGAPGDRILAILRTYQNEDGGFGHALEPDLRAPDSQPLYVEFALRTLYTCKLRDHGMVSRACDFLSKHADLARGIPLRFPSSRDYPRAAHWQSPGSEGPSMDHLIGMVGLANWQGVQHPWLQEAVESLTPLIARTSFSDSHAILTAFTLLESLGEQADTSGLFDKLTQELLQANYFCLEPPVSGYTLTPLDFAPTPDSYCRRIFTSAQISAHLDDLVSRQEPDGGWPIAWTPPGQMAVWEWRSQWTLNALHTLRAYGRL